MSRTAPIAALCLLFLASPARATKDEIGQHYTGATLGAGLIAGPHILGADTAGRVGYVLGAYARFNTVMTVFAVQTQYDFSDNQLSIDGADVAVRRHSFSSSFHFHPLFLRLLTNNYFWYVVTSWYFESGAGLEITTIDSRGLDLDRTDVAGSLHVGSGFELPLDDPDDRGAFWLGVSWRYKLVFMNPHLGQLTDLDAHMVTMTLAYRYNNVSAARVKRPPELKWR